MQDQIQIQNIQEGLLLGQTDGQRSAGLTGLCGLRLNVPFPCDRGFTLKIFICLSWMIYQQPKTFINFYIIDFSLPTKPFRHHKNLVTWAGRCPFSWPLSPGQKAPCLLEMMIPWSFLAFTTSGEVWWACECLNIQTLEGVLSSHGADRDRIGGGEPASWREFTHQVSSLINWSTIWSTDWIIFNFNFTNGDLLRCWFTGEQNLFQVHIYLYLSFFFLDFFQFAYPLSF